MPLILILVDSGIELIPKSIRSHSAVKRTISKKNYASQLLDNALHHTAMHLLRDNQKRGRPDLVHLCLLNALGSPLNKNKNLKLYLHTNRSKIFHFNPEIRITRNFNRFKGLMAKLLIDGQIKVKEGFLISQFRGNLVELLDTISDPEVYLFSHKGALEYPVQDLFQSEISKNIVAVIGGFQKGFFSKMVLSLSDRLISISKYKLDAWIVVSKIINSYEMAYNIF
ncbi:MAG: hypothetical protein GF353_22770 [Candidatus Lokiarchaeota archaeon]|nr:hypothetical protein [Candidatus Lokiarchaeota archaeon]